MCIILGIPFDKNVSKKELKKCFDYNNDGAGFAYFDGKSSVISKGYMSFNRFYKAYTTKRKEFTTSNFIVHFRIATHGVINESMTQPFPCSPTMLMSDLASTDISSDIVIAHNGIISGYGEGTYSDTAHFIYTVLAPLSNKRRAWYKSAAIMQLLDLLIDSKMIVFIKNQFYFIGDFTLENGVYYSNLCHRRVHTFTNQKIFNNIGRIDINNSSKLFANTSKINEGIIHFTSGNSLLVDEFHTTIYISDEYDYYIGSPDNLVLCTDIAWICDECDNLIAFDSTNSTICEVIT